MPVELPASVADLHGMRCAVPDSMGPLLSVAPSFTTSISAAVSLKMCRSAVQRMSGEALLASSNNAVSLGSAALCRNDSPHPDTFGAISAAAEAVQGEARLG